MAEIKTNAMRILEREKVKYKPLYYDIGDREFSGELVSEITGAPKEQSFKTLTARGQKRGILVFVVPVSGELDLKKAATVSGDKSVEMLHVKELLGVTGYMRGEVSPIGMKKKYPTYIDETAGNYDEIYVSAGKKGCTAVLNANDLAKMLGAEFADLTK